MAGQHSYASFLLGDLYNDPTVVKYLPDVERFGSAVVLGCVLIYFGSKLAKRLKQPKGQADAIIPSREITAFSFFEAFVEAAVKYYDSVLGDKGREHFPFVFSVFIFILFANLLGLIPGMPSIANTVWVNVGMAFVVFYYFNAQGVRAHGLGGYLKHFCGPILLLAPFMFVLEILSLCLRVLTLNLRLYWNIKADHVAVSTFTDLLGHGLPAGFYVLGTFVSFMQAFIFSTLTMVYILLASQHDEEEAHH